MAAVARYFELLPEMKNGYNWQSSVSTRFLLN